MTRTILRVGAHADASAGGGPIHLYSSSLLMRSAGRAPMIRIGIVLNEDEIRELRLTPAGALAFVGADPGTKVAGVMRVRQARGAIEIELDGCPPRPAPQLRLDCGAAGPVLVHDVVAGRGFHWQTRIDVALPGSIEILPGSSGLIVVNELSLEQYLAGVVTAEMAAACPGEFLKAQCVVARSWLLAMTEPKHASEPFDRCNDDCCQRYQGLSGASPSALAAVSSTTGVILVAPTGVVLDANYSKSCGGISELAEAVWSAAKPGISAVVDAPAGSAESRFLPVTEANLPEYLDGDWLARTTCYCSPNVVSTPDLREYLGRVDTVDEYFRWTVRHAHDELAELLPQKCAEMNELTRLTDMRVLSRGVSGRASRLALDWLDRGGGARRTVLESEYEIRRVLHRRFLYSSAFDVRIERAGDGSIQAVTLRGAGWGHGVGLCQIGGLGMALRGHDCDAICRHYYPLARLERAY